MRPLPGGERWLDPVLRADGVEPDRGHAQAAPGGRGVEQLLVGAQGRDRRVHVGMDPCADLQALRVAAQQRTVVVEPLVAFDVPALALDALVPHPQVGQVGGVLRKLVDDRGQLGVGGVGEVGEGAVGPQQSTLVLDPVPERGADARPRRSPARRSSIFGQLDHGR